MWVCLKEGVSIYVYIGVCRMHVCACVYVCMCVRMGVPVRFMCDPIDMVLIVNTVSATVNTDVCRYCCAISLWTACLL